MRNHAMNPMTAATVPSRRVFHRSAELGKSRDGVTVHEHAGKR